MLYGVKKLTKEKFQLAREKGASTFLYNEIDFDFKEFEKDNLVFYNCSQDRIESTWYTWEQNDQIYKVFREKFDRLFVFGKYDLGLAYQKALYWSNQKSGFLNYARKENYPKQPILYFESLYPYNKSKILIKYTFNLLSSLIKKNDNIGQQTKTKADVGVFIKQEFQLTLYKHLINKMKHNNAFVFFVYQDEVEKGLLEMGVEKKQIVKITIPPTIVKPNFQLNLFKLKKEDWYVLNQLLIHQKEIAMWCYIGVAIASSGIKKLLMNEAENGVMGAVLGEIMNKNNIVSYNTMNGMKSGQAQDYFINFNKWFVWDELMADLLLKNNYLTKDKLIISGHLMEEEVNKYEYKNTLGIDLSDLSGKLVISLFSVYGATAEKKRAFTFLKDYLATRNTNAFLFIRPHPAENSEELLQYESENIYIVKYDKMNSKTTLYDQLYISDISICFGSTVALESKWFGVPCLSIEDRKKSLIYCIDNESIYLGKSITSEIIENLIDKKKEMQVSNNRSVSRTILNALLNE